MTTRLSRHSQLHQTVLVSHVDAWDAETTVRLQQWTDHFVQQGADSFTASRRAIAMVYRTTVEQAQTIAHAEEFWLLSIVFVASLALLPFMSRVRVEPPGRRTEPAIRPLPAPTD